MSCNCMNQNQRTAPNLANCRGGAEARGSMTCRNNVEARGSMNGRCNTNMRRDMERRETAEMRRNMECRENADMRRNMERRETADMRRNMECRGNSEMRGNTECRGHAGMRGTMECRNRTGTRENVTCRENIEVREARSAVNCGVNIQNRTARANDNCAETRRRETDCSCSQTAPASDFCETIPTENRKELLCFISEVSFAAYDAMLYLDAHMEDHEARHCFQKYNALRNRALEIYAKKYGPLTISTVGESEHCSWEWRNQPWPWELEGGNC